MLKKKRKDIFHQLHLSKAKMAHRREILRGMYEELKEMCQKPDVELLQENRKWLSRREGVHITLHREEANSHIFPYEILRSMCVGCNHQDAPYITATPRNFLAWGPQTFISGKYYWEVHVGDSWNWAFGVCNTYWKEKNQNEKIDGEEGLFLLGCVKNDIQCHLFTTSPLMLQYIPRPTNRVGLFLDYEAKT
ncbi:hypothetical protein H8959_003398, partial [Pygathrix nigripes]